MTNSSTGMSASSWPRPITIRCSAVWAISLIRCEETNTVRPSAARRLSRFRTHWIPSTSRPLTGSSNITVRGSHKSAEAIPSRCPIPSENVPARLRATLSRPTISTSSRTRAGRRRGSAPTRGDGCTRCGQDAASAPPVARPPRPEAPDAPGSACHSPAPAPNPARSRPRIRRIVVDLPAPFGPRNPVTTPGLTVKLRSRTAVVLP